MYLFLFMYYYVVFKIPHFKNISHRVTFLGHECTLFRISLNNIYSVFCNRKVFLHVPIFLSSKNSFGVHWIMTKFVVLNFRGIICRLDNDDYEEEN